MEKKHWTTFRMSENTYLIYDPKEKRGALIDPGDRLPEMESFIEKEGLEITHIYLTHGHADHMGGVPYYKEKYGATVVAAKKEKELLQSPLKNLSTLILDYDLTLEADQYVEDGDLLEPYGIEVIETPGHTVGSVTYRQGEDYFTGDLIFQGSAGRSDFPTGNYASLVKSLDDKIFSREKGNLYPGHGPATTIERERMINPFSPQNR